MHGPQHHVPVLGLLQSVPQTGKELLLSVMSNKQLVVQPVLQPFPLSLLICVEGSRI